MEKEIQFIPLQKAIMLEDSIGFLSSLQYDENITVIVGESLKPEDQNIEYSKLLQQLVILNKQRQDILKKFNAAKQ